MEKSLSEQLRLSFSPKLPNILLDLETLAFEKIGLCQSLEEIAHSFSAIAQSDVLGLTKNRVSFSGSAGIRVGVVFSGGQAPGGHNVVAGLFEALSRLNSKNVLIGFLGGPQGIISGKIKELKKQELDAYKNMGGFDLLGSGRTKIETEEQLAQALHSVKDLKLDGLVVIGGDDSNTNAAVLADYFMKQKCATRVIGVPKTIDGDLKNTYVPISFGFDTATKIYANLIGNLAKDALSDKRYYHFIKLMGRSASHIALECALQTRPNLTFIGEEKKSLAEIIDELAALVMTRASRGKQFGIVLIPEGLIEFIPEIKDLIGELSKRSVESLSAASSKLFASFPESIQKQFLLGRDSHGNLNVSAIQTDQLLIELLKEELKKRDFKAPFMPISHFFGYEGRSALPSNFDATYAEALGYTAALLIHHNYTGYMSFVSNLTASPLEWHLGGVPLTSLMHFEMRKGKKKAVIAKTVVDLKGKPYLIYQREKEAWALDECYLFPGPIQFFGPSEITDAIPLILSS